MKNVILLILVICLGSSLFGCTNAKGTSPANTEPQTVSGTEKDQTTDTNEKTASIEYANKQYGFKFNLPESWKGYTVITDKWEGLAIGDSQGEKVIETGPIISIRHPLWTSQNPRQDIPIMVFTKDQWNSLKNEKFHIGAAPIGPSELARNSKFVFALPARYNYAFPTGYEEVEKILNSNPIQATEDFNN